MKLRSILLVLGLIVAALGAASPSYARTFELHQNVSHGQLQSACNAAGGSFSDAPDGSGYACGTNCKGGPGTNCYVACDNGGKCTGVTPGRLVANVTLLQFLRGSMIAPLALSDEDTGTPLRKHPAPDAPPPVSTPGVPVLE